VALGASFRMASRMVQLVRDESGLGICGGCRELIASKYTRFACAVDLQILSEALEHVSGFSIALDSSTLHGMSYLDVRIRFSLHDVIYNFHILALPLFDRHTGEDMSDVLVQFLNAFYPQWRDILVGSSTDGARSMTGNLGGLSTRFGQCSPAKLIRIWCGLHQLDLVMQKFSIFRLKKNSIQLCLDWTPAQTAEVNIFYAVDMSKSCRHALGLDVFGRGLTCLQHYCSY
jgi:hypothetical protein